MSKAITLLVAGDGGPAERIDLLEAVFWGFLKNPKGTRFEVPFGDPGLLLGSLGDRFQIWPLGTRPWQGAAGPFSLPVVRSIRRTDLVLLVGSLETRTRAALALATLVTKGLSRPLVAYGVAIDRAVGATGRWILGRCDGVVAFDGASEAEARRLGVSEIIGRAVPAFHLRGATARSVETLVGGVAGERIGLELDALTRRGLDPAAIVRGLAAATGTEPVLLAENTNAPTGTRALRRDEHRAETWTGILGAFGLFVGERPAWLLRGIAMGAPVLALGEDRGVAVVLDDLGLADLLEKDTPAAERIERVTAQWRERSGLAKRVRAASALARAAAREAAARVARRYLQEK